MSVASPEWVTVTAGPLRGHQILRDVAADWQQPMVDGSYDAFIYDTIDGLKSFSGATVWDVGAHFGYHTLALASLVGPHGRVVAFEPNQSNLARLAVHLERNPVLAARIDVIGIALADREGDEVFVFSNIIRDGTSSGSHLARATLPSPAEEYAAFEREIIHTRTADGVWRDGRLGVPTLLKIDVEGAESIVLEGARSLLQSMRPLLFIEVHNVIQMFRVQKLLLELDYTTEILDPEHASLSRCFILAKGA